MNVVLLPSFGAPIEHPFFLSQDEKFTIAQSLMLAIENVGRESFASSLISPEFMAGKFKMAA